VRDRDEDQDFNQDTDREDTDGDGDTDRDTPVDSPDSPEDTPVDTDPVRPQRGWDVFPSGAAIGQTVVASVVSFGDMSTRGLVNVEVIGPTPVEVGALQRRSAAEALVVLTVSERGRAVPHDVLLTFADGTGVWLEDAFIIVEDPSAAPQDYWDGGTPEAPVDTPADSDSDSAP
jgi:hypothetical protein